MKKLFTLISVGLFLFLFFVDETEATSQWSRKYQVSCNTCHSAFPRLNSFGESFMLNGYQMPGTQDGDETEKHLIGDRLNLNQLTDILGLRINVSPATFETNGRDQNGVTQAAFDISNPSWLQLFTAGTIYKDVSIFIETEFEKDAIKVSWYRLGFHNLFGTSLLNVRVGRTSPLEWHGISGRLRAIPNIKHQMISSVKSSNGSGDDSVAFASAVPALSVYGFTDPIVYEIGVSNGAHEADVNEYKNVWATLKSDVAPSGPFGGSSVSVWGFYGRDTLDNDPTDSGSALIENEYYRLSGAFNLRFLDLDLQAGYFYGHEANFDLATAGDEEVVIHGVAAILGYKIDDNWYAAVQYDWVTSLDDSSLAYMKLSPSVWFFPRDNFRIGLVGRYALENDASDGLPHHEVLMNIRAMF